MYAKLSLIVVAALAAVSSAAPVLETRSETGDLTFYAPGLGSCGETNKASDHIVALSHFDMNNPANPNKNPKCNKMINIHYKGKTVKAKVTDTCEGCNKGSIDVTPSLFQEIAGSLSIGRVHGVKWEFA